MCSSPILNNKLITLNSKSENKKEILAEIANIASSNIQLSKQSKEEIYDKLLLRENSSSTALTNSIAIPHCSIDNIDDFVIGIIRTIKPVLFNSNDKSMTKLFIYIIGPTTKRNKHIQIISSIAKALSNESLLNILLEEDSIEDITKAFNSTLIFRKEKKYLQEQSKITIVIQKEEYFDELIKMISGEIQGSIVVYEAESASRYLHKIPLFASFWGGMEESFCKVITIIIDSIEINNTIRKVKELVPNIENESGVLLTVSDIKYSIGSLNI